MSERGGSVLCGSCCDQHQLPGQLHSSESLSPYPIGGVVPEPKSKPFNNLMLHPDGYIKVPDFGVARQAGTDRAEDELAVGTLGYMSPEEVLQRPITAASDIFSLGIVLYELASGTNPFRGDSAVATTRLIQGLEAPPLPSLEAIAQPRKFRRRTIWVALVLAICALGGTAV
jgi:hypothetical protein